MNRFLLQAAGAVLLLAGWVATRPVNVAAAVIASDAAANPAYAAESDGGWKGQNPQPLETEFGRLVGENPPGTDNGGFGFQPWDFADGYHYPDFSPYGRLNHFIDGVDFAHSSFNNLGAPAFGLTNANLAFGGSTSRATRVLDAPLTVGGSVTLDFDNPELSPSDPFAPSGFVIRLNSGGGPKSQVGVSERFGFLTTFGFNNGNWSTTDSVGFTDLGLPSTQTTSGATFRFTLTGAESYSLEILPLGGGAALAGTSGSLANPGAGAIDSIELLMFENGSGNGIPGPAAQPTGESEFYFNRLSVETGGLEGDYDADGDVDGDDLAQWRGDFGVNGLSDADDDGDSDGDDFLVWQRQLSSSQIVAATAAVPEPATLLLIVSGAVAMFVHGRIAVS